MAALGLLSLLLLLALAAVLGWAAVAALSPPVPTRRPEPALALVAGLVGVAALLLLFDLAGVPWRRGPLLAGWAAATAAAAAVAWRRRGGGAGQDYGAGQDGRRRGAAARALGEAARSASGSGLRAAWRALAPGSLGWGDAVAAGAALTYAAAAWTRRITIPDFVYHWGPKAKRALIEGGIDYSFLADPLRLTDHPDYPSLVPGLYAAVGVVRGAFHERASLLLSVVFFGLALAGARRAAATAGLPRFAVQGTAAAVALALAAVGIGYRMAGAADWAVVAALLVALPALVGAAGGRGTAFEEARSGHALRLGVAAALAAGAKIEGVPLAAVLVAVGAVRLGVVGRARGGAAGAAAADLARLLVPPLLLVAPWAVQNLRHGLFAAENTGPLSAARVPVALRAAAESFATPEWLGLPWLLLLLPGLLALRATRAAAAVILLQGAFYGWVFLTSPVDTRFLVLSSLPRLVFHLVPPLLVLLAVAMFSRSRRLRRGSGRRRCRTRRTGCPGR